ncbi:hypothetical protein ACIQMJ_10685 [Actinosynnema sp. NPDC091369]
MTAVRRKPPRRGPALRLPFAAHIALWLVLGVAVAALTAWVLWLLLGQPTLRPANSGPATSQEKFDGLKIALTVVGGIGGVIALTVAYRKQRLGEAAERREDTKAHTDRFCKASELIGSSQAAVRLAGIYAMAALADDWDDHRQMCVDVLCAYLRMPCDPPASAAPTPGNRGLGLRKPRPVTRVPAPSAAAAEDPREEQQVRHTVIRVIAAHLRPDAQVPWHGRTFDFTGATFDGGDLSGIRVGPDTRLIFDGATFAGGYVGFTDVTVAGGEIDFKGAAVSAGHLDFGGSSVSAGEVDFDGATISGGEVDFGHVAVSGGRCYFGDVTVSGGQVHFAGGLISGGGIDFGGAVISGGDLHFATATISGGHVDFGGAVISGGEVDFRDVTFSGGTVDFADATVAGGQVLFDGATFSGGTVNVPAGVRLPSPPGSGAPGH